MSEINKEADVAVTDESSNQTVTKESQLTTIDDNHVNDATRGLNSINLFDASQLAAAENFLTKVMRSDKGGIKSVNDGLAILMRAKDLNLPFSTCIEHVHVINGKTGVDIHVIKALLSRAGVTWTCVHDYAPLYECTDGINVYSDDKLPDYAIRCMSAVEAIAKRKDNPDTENVYVYPVKWYKDFNGNVYKDYQLNTNKHQTINTKKEAIELAAKHIIGVYRIPNVPIDYVTEYELYRTINGKETSSKGRFTQSEAYAAGMFEKDTYKKYPKVLIGHRAFTYAARDIASDIIFGVMETTELKIVSGKELNNADIVDVEVIEVNK